MGAGRVVLVVSNSRAQEVAPQTQTLTVGSYGGQVGLGADVVVINSKLHEVIPQTQILTFGS